MAVDNCRLKVAALLINKGANLDKVFAQPKSLLTVHYHTLPFFMFHFLIDLRIYTRSVSYSSTEMSDGLPR